jgi:hypothetical protein
MASSVSAVGDGTCRQWCALLSHCFSWVRMAVWGLVARATKVALCAGVRRGGVLVVMSVHEQERLWHEPSGASGNGSGERAPFSQVKP